MRKREKEGERGQEGEICYKPSSTEREKKHHEIREYVTCNKS